MKIEIIKADKNYGELMLNKQIHLVLPATLMGFGMCMAYLRFNCRMDDNSISRFVNQVNDKREVGCLFPRYSLSLFPSRFDEWEKNIDGFSEQEMSKFFMDIIEIEKTHIKSNHIVIDLFASSMLDNEVRDFCNYLENFTNTQLINYQNILIEIRTNIK